jgi:hypothetical protein
MTGTQEPWPDWLADLTPEQRVREIINEHAHWCHSAGDRCSGAGAGDLLLRLLDEAREQAPVLAVTPELRDRIDAALQDSIDSCARCKACDVQVDAVMAVIRESRSETPVTAVPPAGITVTVSRDDLCTILADAWMLSGNPEAFSRLAVAAGLLEPPATVSGAGEPA